MVSDVKLKELKEMAKQVRRNVVTCVGTECPGHLGGSMSSADLVTALYFYKMNYDPKDPKRDRFILSKGHASAAIYSVLAETGFFKPEELVTHCKNGSRLSGHATHKIPGI